MRNEKKFLKSFLRNPHAVQPFFERPYLSRRAFFQAGAGVTGMFLAGKPALGQDVIKRGGAATNGKAKNVIFILLAGAPSHVDTFDFIDALVADARAAGIGSPAVLIVGNVLQGVQAVAQATPAQRSVG